MKYNRKEKQIRICRDEDMSDTAKELMTQIALAKKEAVLKGIIREEKSMPPIENKEIPYSLPDGWQWIRLGDYALKVTDYVASGSFASLKENVLITNEPNYAIMVKTADFSNGFTKNLTYTDEHGYEFLSNSNLFGGELILSNIGSIGKVFIVPYLEQPMTLASNTVMVKVTDDSLIKYLYYYFLSPLGQRTLFSISSGTSMMKFNKTQLKNILVPVAPLEVQQEIVKQIESVSKVIELRKKELKNLDKLIKARFVELFVGKDYPLVALDDLSLGKGEYGAQSASIEYNPSRPRYVRITDIQDDGTLNDDVVSSANIEDDEQYKLSYGDFMFARMGATVGKTYAYKSGNQIFAGYLIRYRLNLKKIIPEYLYAYTKLEEYKNWVLLNQSGAAQPGINAKKYGSLLIPVAPLEEQRAFEDFVTQVDKSKFAVQKALDEAQLLFESLMQKYFG